MTREEFLEKYGKVQVTFSHYYKYTFYYTGEIPDGKITVGYGGDSHEIYRYEVTAGEMRRIEDIYPHTGSVVRDGKEIEGFYDY